MLTEADKSVLNEVYRNSRVGMKAIHSVIGKVYDDDLALDLNRLAYQYARISEKAAGKLYENGLKPQEEGPLNRAVMWGSIQLNTLTDISTEHIAELMIQGSTRGMTEMTIVARENNACGKFSSEMAEELIHFEEKSIQRLKAYL